MILCDLTVVWETHLSPCLSVPWPPGDLPPHFSGSAPRAASTSEIPHLNLLTLSSPQTTKPSIFPQPLSHSPAPCVPQVDNWSTAPQGSPLAWAAALLQSPWPGTTLCSAIRMGCWTDWWSQRGPKGCLRGLFGSPWEKTPRLHTLYLCFWRFLGF